VGQEPVLFAGSISDNIRMGTKKEASDEQVEEGGGGGGPYIYHNLPYFTILYHNLPYF
jgi:hypothetical protein